MNQKRRRELGKAMEAIDLAISVVEDARDEEYDGIDNMPYNLEGTERYGQMEEAAENLDQTAELLSEAKDCLEEAMK